MSQVTQLSGSWAGVDPWLLSSSPKFLSVLSLCHSIHPQHSFKQGMVFSLGPSSLLNILAQEEKAEPLR